MPITGEANFGDPGMVTEQPARNSGDRPRSRLRAVARTVLLIYLWPAFVLAAIEFTLDAGGAAVDGYRGGGLESALAALGSVAGDAASAALTLGLLWPWELWRLL